MKDIRETGQTPDANLVILGEIIKLVQHGRDELGGADYRIARAADFAADALKSGYWAVDIQDARRDLADAEQSLALAKTRIDAIRAQLDRL
jgi:hypothetical protein